MDERLVRDVSLSKEITDAIKALFDLTARIDERVKMLVEANANVEERLDDLRETLSDFSQRVTLIEAKAGKTVSLSKQIHEIKEDNTQKERDISLILTRLTMLEGSNKTNDNRWKMIFDFAMKTVWVIFVCYLLYKLNLQSPPIP